VSDTWLSFDACNLLFVTDNVCLILSDAISRGDETIASNLVKQLAAKKAAVKIRLDDPENDELTRGGTDNKIKLVYHYLHLKMNSCKRNILNVLT
jgi:hypothetical protein